MSVDRVWSKKNIDIFNFKQRLLSIDMKKKFSMFHVMHVFKVFRFQRPFDFQKNFVCTTLIWVSTTGSPSPIGRGVGGALYGVTPDF